MQDAWDFYFAKVDDELASIFANLSIDDRAPVARYTHMVMLRLTMLYPRPDGLSSEEEFDTLAAIDDALSAALARSGNAIYVGRVTYAGLRDHYYYAMDAEAAGRSARQTIANFPAYKFEVFAQPDAEWKTYRNFLLPSPKDRQRIGNRNASDELRDGGDPLTKPREIDHWVFFPSIAERDDFVSRATAIGYKLRFATDPDPASDGTAFSAQIYRTDVPGNDMFDAITYELSKLAQECGGDYDGWESPLEKPPEPN